MSLRVLVIDDDPGLEAMVAACCAPAQPERAPEFAFAASDTEALALLHAERAFDVALVGVDGGRVSGMQIFKRLMERSLRVPRIALTDGRNLDHIRAAINDGASDFLVKPLRGDDLLKTLGRVMEKVARRRRNWGERAAYSALRREVDIAADMQRRILPARFPTRPRLDLHACMHPAHGIGGDFYDVFAIDAERVGFLIADVSGKGIPAAFYMAIASTALRSAAMSGTPPGQCLSEVNEFMAARDIPGMFVSVFYGVVDTSTWSLRCANAGHPPPLLSRQAGAATREFDCAGGPVVGIMSGITYGQSELELAPGDALVLYTDGVTEAYDGARNLFGAQRLARLLSAADSTTASGIIGAIDSGIADFTRGAQQHDDITALVLKRAG